MTCMKRKKMFEKQMDTIANTKPTLEQQQMTLESMTLNEAILSTQQEAATAIKKSTAAMGGVDKVDEVMDEIEDGLVEADEMANAMSRNVANPALDDLDEDELL